MNEEEDAISKKEAGTTGKANQVVKKTKAVYDQKPIQKTVAWINKAERIDDVTNIVVEEAKGTDNQIKNKVVWVNRAGTNFGDGKTDGKDPEEPGTSTPDMANLFDNDDH